MEFVREDVTSGWKHLWYTWDLRIAVLFSTFLQIFLIFFAPLRKQTSSAYLLVPMWFAYLLADATAIYAAGLISRGQVETFGPFAHPDLVAFWASFLLVHLGGPDTITAFALEDNELWLRHLLGLGFPCGAVVYSLIQSFPKKKLLVPTVLIFVAGLIKYIERTLSLYLATSRTIKELPPVGLDLGPKYANFTDEYKARIEAQDMASEERYLAREQMAAEANPVREQMALAGEQMADAALPVREQMRTTVQTVLIFVAGLIMYIERTLSLYLATSRTIKESPPAGLDLGPKYANFMDEYKARIEGKDMASEERRPTREQMAAAAHPVIEEIVLESIRILDAESEVESVEEANREMEEAGSQMEEAGSPVTVETVPARRLNEINKEDELTDLMVLQTAYHLFNTFRGLTADLLFGSEDCYSSRRFFLETTPADAFKVLEVELNFFYDILHTKASVVQGMLGYLVRMLLLILDCTSLALFYFLENKEFTNFDTGLTYILLVGALALDLIASIMVLKSYWTAVALKKFEHPSRGIAFLLTLLNVDKERWPKNHGKRPRWFSKPHRRWSGTLSQYNLINYCLHPRSEWWEKTIGIFRLTNILDRMNYVKTVEFSNDLRDFIFEELKMKSKIANDLTTTSTFYAARGDWILSNENCTELLRWTNEVDFDESLLLWHIATELCFNTDESSTCTDNGTTNPNSACNKTFRDSSKFLSDYMLYLLILQSSMISTLVGGVQIRFADTCADAKKFFEHRNIRKVDEGKNCCLDMSTFGNCFFCNELEEGQQQSKTSCCFKKCCRKEGKWRDNLQIQACKSILDINIENKIVAVKGDHTRSVLFKACVLAKELKKLGSERMWQIISKVWVEMLSYAACHCRANIHAANLSKGGQLITLVWLLNCHLGLGNQITQGLRSASNEN